MHKDNIKVLLQNQASHNRIKPLVGIKIIRENYTHNGYYLQIEKPKQI